MDIFKLIFEHDLRLDDLASGSGNVDYRNMEASIDDFMRPDRTYSRFYLSGTRLNEELFGLDRLENWPELANQLDKGLSGYRYFTKNGVTERLSEALEQTKLWEAIVLSGEENIQSDLPALHMDSDSNTGHRKEPLREAMISGELVLYKEQAHNGFDLHLFSEKNIYPDLFEPLKTLVSSDFRFFSMNGKRIRTERKFFFETWALERPPHGVEEVFEGTVL